VKRTSSFYEKANEHTRITVLGTVNAHDVEWVCLTCEKYLKRNQLPHMAIANDLEFSLIPDDLPVLTDCEWRVVFMKIRQSSWTATVYSCQYYKFTCRSINISSYAAKM
jgi:hypothetical protein